MSTNVSIAIMNMPLRDLTVLSGRFRRHDPGGAQPPPARLLPADLPAGCRCSTSWKTPSTRVKRLLTAAKVLFRIFRSEVTMPHRQPSTAADHHAASLPHHSPIAIVRFSITRTTERRSQARECTGRVHDTHLVMAITPTHEPPKVPSTLSIPSMSLLTTPVCLGATLGVTPRGRWCSHGDTPFPPHPSFG